MKTEYLIKNIIFDDLKLFDIISFADLERIKNEQISNEMIDILIG